MADDDCGNLRCSSCPWNYYEIRHRKTNPRNSRREQLAGLAYANYLLSSWICFSVPNFVVIPRANTLTIACVAGRGRDQLAKNVRKKGKEQHTIPIILIKKPVSNKQPSIISSPCKIQKSKKEVMHTQVCSADLFSIITSHINLSNSNR